MNMNIYLPTDAIRCNAQVRGMKEWKTIISEHDNRKRLSPKQKWSSQNC